MGKFVQQQEAQKALQEKKKTRKETMGKYFYDLSKLTFAAMVLGGMISFFQGNEPKWITVIGTGLFIVVGLVYIGNNILKW